MDRRDLLHFTTGLYVAIGIFLVIELADEKTSRRPGPWAHLLKPAAPVADRRFYRLDDEDADYPGEEVLMAPEEADSVL